MSIINKNTVYTVCGDIVLYCIVLYCIVLYCIVLYCIVLYCIVLYCIVLYCPRLQQRVIKKNFLYCIVLAKPNPMPLYCIVLYCIMRPYTDGPIGPLSYAFLGSCPKSALNLG